MAKSTTVKKDTVKEKVTPLPKGALIMSENVTTDVEEIENGYLITKRTETRYKMKESDSYAEWHNDTKKWYSETDPLTINIDDKSLAEAFAE